MRKQNFLKTMLLLFALIVGSTSVWAEEAIFVSQSTNNLTSVTIGKVTLTDGNNSTGIQQGSGSFTIGSSTYTPMKLSGSRIFNISVETGYQINSITAYATTNSNSTATAGTNTNTGKCDEVPVKGSTPVVIDYTGETQIRFSSQSLVVLVVNYSAVATSAPEITTNLSATADVTVGIAEEFSIVASGATSYQWYKGTSTTADPKNDTAISGATSAAYSYTATAAGTEYIYCVATNAIGSTTSAVCAVKATAPASAPTFTTDLNTAYNVNKGSDLVLSIVAEDAASYQWYLDGSAISGATTDSYTFTGTTVNATNEIYCAATNAAGTTNSTTATITTKGSSACQLIGVQFSNSAYGTIAEPSGENNGSVTVPYLAGESAPTVTTSSFELSTGATASVAGNSITVTAEDGTTTAVYDITTTAITPLDVTADIAETTFTEVPSWMYNPYGWDSGKGVKFGKDVNEAANMRISKGFSRQYYFIGAAQSITLTSGTAAGRNIKVYRNGTLLSSPTKTAASNSSIEIELDATAACMIMIDGVGNNGDGGFTKYAITAAGSTTTVDVTGVTLDESAISLEVGASQTLVATVAPEDATDNSVTWTSSNDNVATVDSDGKVTAVAAGTATITVTTTDGGKTATCTVTVTEAATPATTTGGDVDFDYSASGASASEWTQSPITVSSNATQIDNSNKFIKSWSGEDLTVTVAGTDALVTKVVLTYQGTNRLPSEITANDKTEVTTSEATQTWENANGVASVTFTLAGSPRLTKVSVEYASKVAVATLNGDGYATFSYADDVQIYGVKAYSASLDINAKQITCTQAAGNKVPAGTGVLLYGTGDASVYAKTTTGVDALASNDLKATTKADGTLVTLDNTKYFYVLSGSSFVKYTGAAFVADKAYFESDIDLASSSARGFSIVFEDNDATGIKAIEKAQQNGGEYYNLAGQRVAQPKKGLYIVNGKKVIIK